MALTRDLKDPIVTPIKASPRDRDGMFKEGVESLLYGELAVGKALLRDYIKATVGFQRLGSETGSSPKSLIRMFGPSGNPQAHNLFTVIRYLQRRSGVTLHVTAKRKRTAQLVAPTTTRHGEVRK